MESNVFTIDLDCAPGMTRPNDLLPFVLKDTGIDIDPENTTSRFYGNWEWKIPDNQIEQYKKVREIIRKRITELYNSGRIRYGSW